MFENLFGTPLQGQTDTSGINSALFGMDPNMANQAQSQGMLGLAAGLLQASGPSRMPTSLGQVIASGLQGGQNAYQNSLKNQYGNMQAASQVNQAKLGMAQTAMMLDNMDPSTGAAYRRMLGMSTNPTQPQPAANLGTPATNQAPTQPPTAPTTQPYVAGGMPAAPANAGMMNAAPWAQAPAANAQASDAPAAASAATQGQNPYVLPYMDPHMAAQMYLSDPAGYKAALLKSYEPQQFRGGSAIVVNNKIVGMVPNLDKGMTLDANGNAVNMSGYLPAKSAQDVASQAISTYFQGQQANQKAQADATWRPFEGTDSNGMPIKYPLGMGGMGGLPGMSSAMSGPPSGQIPPPLSYGDKGPAGMNPGALAAAAAGLPAGAIQAGLSPARQAEQADIGKANAAQYTNIVNAGNAASGIIANVGEMQKAAANGLVTGPMTDVKARIGGLAQQLGLNPKNYTMLMADPNDAAAVNKAATRLGFDFAKTLGGRVTQQEVSMAMNANPNIKTPQGAYNNLLNVVSGMARYQRAERDAAVQYKNQNGTMDGFSTWMDKQMRPADFWSGKANTNYQVFARAYVSPQERAEALASMSQAQKQQLLASMPH